MANPSHDEGSLLEDKDRVSRLVDYSSSSEDENPAPLPKKQRRSDSFDYGSSNSDLEEDQPEQSKTFVAEDDSDEEDICFNTDNEFLSVAPYSWREIDKWNLPEVYAVFVAGKSPRTKSKCLKLLDLIGCQDRFLGCSVEMSRTFFANLNKDEAAKMEAVKGVHHVIQYRHCFFDV